MTQYESLAYVLRKALDIEERIGKFYSDAAEKSKGLLADVPRAFERIARKRQERKEKLQSLSSDEAWSYLPKTLG